MSKTSLNNKSGATISKFHLPSNADKAGEKAELKKWLSTLDSKEKDKAEALLSVIKSGKFILMIGSFCPLFWKSLFSGDSTSVVLFNLGHSVLYIIIGYIMIKKSKRSLYAMKNKA